MDNQQYSVLMSVYKKERPEYLRQSIESMLGQTIPPSDFVLVCDGPLGGELDQVVSSYGKNHDTLFQIVRLPENVGLGKALNQGIKYCKYDLIARMDSDDLSLNDRCEKQLAVFANQNVDIVSGTLIEFEHDPDLCSKERELPQFQSDILKFAKRRNPFNHPCVMYRKSSVQAAGGYKHFEGFEDYYLWVRMLKQNMQGYNIPSILLKMRVENMYDRRGGLSYARNVIRFRSYLLRTGFSGLSDFIITVTGHVFVSIMPNKLRALFYNKLLRKNK